MNCMNCTHRVYRVIPFSKIIFQVVRMKQDILFPARFSFAHLSGAFRISTILKFLLILTALVTLAASSASAQFYSVSGMVTDEHDTPLPEANVALFTQADTLLLRGAPANQEGAFTLRRVPEGSYNLIVSYLGYQSAMIPVDVRDRDITGLQIRIQQQPLEMDGLEITARPEPVQVRGDTTVSRPRPSLSAPMPLPKTCSAACRGSRWKTAV